MKKLLELKSKVAALQTEIDELRAKAEDGTATDEDVVNVKEKMDELKALNVRIQTLEELEANQEEIQASAESVHPDVEVTGPAAEQEPYPMGNYLQDIVSSAKSIASGGVAVPRVVNYQQRIMAAATGAGEAVPSDGGFLVGEDYAAGLIKRAYDNNQVISRCTRRTLSGNANSMKLNGIDETSRANGSRHGGIRSYWMAEADDMTGSKPKFRQLEMELKEHGVLFYATDRMLDDAAFLEQEVNDAVSDEIGFKTQDAIINGTGAGQPLGILNSGCLISQAKETGQDAATIVYENYLKMLTRKWGPLANYVWLINQEIYPQLGQMNLAVGTGGAPVYVPSSGANEAPFQFLGGRPMIEIEQAAALGTVGDIILADLSQYVIIEKGGVQAAMSIHVEFLSNQTVLRWITRVDGQPSWNSALTPFKGSATRSPFVTIAARA